MPPTPGTSWTCPGCQRAVPARVEECYCGVKRSQAPAQRAEPPASAARVWLLSAVLLAALAVLLATALRREAASPPAASADSARLPAASIVPFDPDQRPARPPVTPAPQTRAIVESEMPPAPLEEPSALPPSPDPSPTESLDAVRELAAESFSRALLQMAGRADGFGKDLQQYQSACRSGAGPWPAAGCDGIRQQLRGTLQELESALEAANEEARRGHVYPGVRAEIRRHHGLDEEAWSALLRRARETLE